MTPGNSYWGWKDAAICIFSFCVYWIVYALCFVAGVFIGLPLLAGLIKLVAWLTT